MNFQESVKYLYGLGNEVLAMKLGLENIRKLLAALGNPEKNYLKVQVAGTNGKGSTCVFLEAICVSAKIKTGMTTSPHLVSVTERVRINGAEISEEDFAEYATQVREVSEDLVERKTLETVPTYFEQVTAIALVAFADAKVELAILETGLGGRFDATTAAEAEIIGITPIDFDHQNILGNSLKEIAAEKAAIIRKDTKVIIAEQKSEALRVILEKSKSLGLVPKFSSQVRTDESVANHQSRITNFQTEKTAYENVKLNLLGKHQIENAKTAILLAETLQGNFDITKENIIEGLQTAQHAGRLEFYGNILFDGAHNIAGAAALKEFLDESVSQPVTMIFGAMRDKDFQEVISILLPKARNLILTEIDNPRSLNESDWQNFAPLKTFDGKVFYASSAQEAYETAEKISADENLILVTGSLYLIGEIKKVLKRRS